MTDEEIQERTERLLATDPTVAAGFKLAGVVPARVVQTPEEEDWDVYFYVKFTDVGYGYIVGGPTPSDYNRETDGARVVSGIHGKRHDYEIREVDDTPEAVAAEIAWLIQELDRLTALA